MILLWITLFFSSLQGGDKDIKPLLDNSNIINSSISNGFNRIVSKHQKQALIYSLFCIHSQAECLLISSLCSQVYVLDPVTVPAFLVTKALNIPRTERRRVLRRVIDNLSKTDTVGTTHSGHEFENHLRICASHAFALTKAMDDADCKALNCLQESSGDRLCRFHEPFMTSGMLESWSHASETEKADFLITYIEENSTEILWKACLDCLNEQIRYFNIDRNRMSSRCNMEKRDLSRKALLRAILDGWSEHSFKGFSSTANSSDISILDTPDTTLSHSKCEERNGKISRVDNTVANSYKNRKNSMVFPKEKTEPNSVTINNMTRSESKYPNNEFTVKQSMGHSFVKIPVELSSCHLHRSDLAESVLLKEPKIEESMNYTVKMIYTEESKSVDSEEEEEKNCSSSSSTCSDSQKIKEEAESSCKVDSRNLEDDQESISSPCSDVDSQKVEKEEEEEKRYSPEDKERKHSNKVDIDSSETTEKLKCTKSDSFCNNRIINLNHSFDEELNAKLMRSVAARSAAKGEFGYGFIKKETGYNNNNKQPLNAMKHVVMRRPKIRAARHKRQRQHNKKTKPKEDQVVEAYLVDRATGKEQPVIAYKI